MKKEERYKSWPSSNLFCCWGHCVFGPDKKFFYLSVSFIVLPSLLFMGLVWPYLFVEWPLGATIPLFIITCTLICCSLIFMLVTRYRDPGIIPRGKPIPFDEENPWKYQEMKPKDTRKVFVSGERMRVKYCETCNIYRPPRCTHCAVCNNCVDRFDHHCPWVGNCVGKRNYQTFLAFIWTTVALIIYILLLSVAQIITVLVNAITDFDGVDSFLHVLRYCYFTVPMCIYCVIAICLVGFLGGFHCVLVCVNQTTNEKLKGLYKRKDNPYDKGCCKNFLSLACAPFFPSYNNFRELVDDESKYELRRDMWPQEEPETPREVIEKQKQRRMTQSKNNKSDSCSIPLLGKKK